MPIALKASSPCRCTLGHAILSGRTSASPIVAGTNGGPWISQKTSRRGVAARGRSSPSRPVACKCGQVQSTGCCSAPSLGGTLCSRSTADGRLATAGSISARRPGGSAASRASSVKWTVVPGDGRRGCTNQWPGVGVSHLRRRMATRLQTRAQPLRNPLCRRSGCRRLQRPAGVAVADPALGTEGHFAFQLHGSEDVDLVFANPKVLVKATPGPS